VGDARQVVVGAAILRAGRVLAARRSAPSSTAGGWEFPGGKVEPGETDAVALVRECIEELGVEVGVGAELGEQQLPTGALLRVYLAELRYGEPQALQDHDALRWLAADELNDVRWLAADRWFVAQLRKLLTPAPPRDLDADAGA
jgi:8-oxo-dGTP diphosphatase